MVKSAGFMQDWLPCTHTDTHTHYTPYPDFQLLPDGSQGDSKHKVQQIKEEKLPAVREAISTGGVKYLATNRTGTSGSPSACHEQLAFVKEFICSFSTRYQN